MPRKKLANSKVKKVKRILNQTEVMEKDFKNLPTQLQVQLRKESSTLKAQETKLLASLKKMQKQHSAAKNKHTLLATKAKVRSTPTAKKQLAAALLLCNKHDQAVNHVMSQLKQLKDQGKVISSKKAKFAALSKQISAFDKEWEIKNVRADKPVAKKLKKTSRKQKIEAPSIKEVSQSEQMTSDLIIETVD